MESIVYRAICEDDVDTVDRLKKEDPTILRKTHLYSIYEKEDYIVAERIRAMIEEE